jgi:zinc protease
VLVDEQHLTNRVTAQGYHSKLAGESYLSVRAFEGVDLDRVAAALADGFARFEKAGVDVAALERAKTAREVGFYDGIGSVLGKAARLARYDLYAGTADFADTDVARLRAVTAADVRRVYEAYIKGRPFVATSFVPKGKVELALEGSARAGVVEEAIVQGAEAAVDPSAGATYARTPSAFDRTREPPSGPRPDVVLPTVWSAQFANGLKAYGIRSEELPVASFELAIAGGRLLDDLAKPGAANLVARMLLRGTARRTPAALETRCARWGRTSRSRRATSTSSCPAACWRATSSGRSTCWRRSCSSRAGTPRSSRSRRRRSSASSRARRCRPPVSRRAPSTSRRSARATSTRAARSARRRRSPR